MFVILIIILVVGPKDIGKTTRSLGKFLNRMYKSEEWKAITQASRTLRNLPNRLAREAELEELDEIRSNFAETSKELVQSTKDMIKDSIPDMPAILDPQVAGSLDDAMEAWTSPPKKKTDNDGSGKQIELDPESDDDKTEGSQAEQN
jgi:Sec-independent protein translocase protein TatA